MHIKESKNKDLHPLSINFKKQQRFNLNQMELTDLILFEYLIMRYSNNGFKEFYSSDDKIYNDTGLKRTKLSKGREKFIKIGLLEVIVKGMPAIQFYNLDYSFLLKNLHLFYRDEFVNDVRIQLLNYKTKKTNDYSLTRKEEKNVKEIINQLEIIYLNTGIKDNIKKFKSKNDIRILKLIYTLSNIYSNDQIMKSFENYTYAILKGKLEHPEDILKHFTSQNKYDNDNFTTLEHWLNIGYVRY